MSRMCAIRGSYRRTRLALMLVSLVVLLGSPIQSEDGRDFAGFYSYTNVVDLGGSYSLTLSARFFNYRGADVSGATVTVEDSFGPGPVYGSAGSVAITNGNSTALTWNLTIPQNEYDFWQAGGMPRLVVQFQDGGNTIRRVVELVVMPE